MNKALALVIGLIFSASVYAQKNLKDTQIAEILLTINEGEQDAAKFAKNKAKNAEVKGFASMMLDQHSQSEKDTKKLAKQEKFTPEDSAMSESLEKEMKATNKDLKNANKNDVDKKYVDQEVITHQKALDNLDTILIPQAQNAALKAHLVKTRDTVASHLMHVKELQTKIK